MNDRDEQIINKLEVIGLLIQRGAKHVHAHPKMALRYFSEAITEVRALMRFIAPKGREINK